MLNELNPQSAHCLICNSANLKHFDAAASDTEHPTIVHVTECKDCSFAWQYPLSRTDQESINHFDLNYKAQGKRLSYYFDPEQKKKIALLEFGFLTELPVEGKHLLDIGAGAGIFAQVAASNGYVVTAIDPALETERLSENGNITAIRGVIDTLPRGELFDVITMWDVIEHVSTPVEVISKARDHLKKGGWLVIETGNYKSAERVANGREHWMYQLDHRWYFSPESIAHVCRQLGFSEIVHSQRQLRPGWRGSADYIGPSRVQLLKSIVKHPSKGASYISRFIELKNATSWSSSGIGIFAMAARK